MATTTIGDLISDLVEMYERRYRDHGLAIVKTALVIDELLRARARRAAVRAAGARRAVQSGGARRAA